MKLKTFIASALLCMFFDVSAFAEESMYARYNKTVESISGASMTIQCSDDFYKIDKKFMSSPKVYWKKGIDWVSLDTKKVTSAGLVFEGLGLVGGVSKDWLRKNGKIKSEINGVPEGYFHIVEKSEFVPYKSTIDVNRGVIEHVNINSINVKLRLNVDEYIKDVKLRNGADFQIFPCKNESTLKLYESTVINARMERDLYAGYPGDFMAGLRSQSEENLKIAERLLREEKIKQDDCERKRGLEERGKLKRVKSEEHKVSSIPDVIIAINPGSVVATYYCHIK